MILSITTQMSWDSNSETLRHQLQQGSICLTTLSYLMEANMANTKGSGPEAAYRLGNVNATIWSNPNASESNQQFRCADQTVGR